MKATLIILGLLAATSFAGLVPAWLECDACTTLVRIVDEYADQNSTLTDIDKALDDLCHHFPGSYEGPCEKVLDTGAEDIIKFIETYETPARVCSEELGFCKSSQKPKPVAVKANVIECSACHSVIRVIDNLLSENKTVEEITHEVEGLCNLIHSEVCDTIVDQYIPLVITYLAKDLSPNMICLKLGFCASSAKKPGMIGAVRANPIECSICHTVVKAIENYVANDQTEEQIEQQLEKVCAMLKSQVCDNIVDNYIPVIIQYLEAKQTPETICIEIGICASSAPKKVQKPVKGGAYCAVCSLLVEAAKQYINSQYTDAQIMAMVEEKVCTGNAFWKAACDLAVNQYLPAILQQLRTDIDQSADQICSAVGAC